jgi:Helix-turn-helix domain
MTTEGTAKARLVRKCPACKLTQYELSSGKCRRCRQPFEVKPCEAKAVEIKPEVLIEAFTDWRALPSSWLPMLLVMQRFYAGSSQRMVAKRLGVNRTYVSRMETNLTPKIDWLPQVAEAYETSLEHLMRMVEYLITGR